MYPPLTTKHNDDNSLTTHIPTPNTHANRQNTYKYLHQTSHQKVYTNACAVPSTHGGGLHGHLGLVMPDAAYTALARVQFQLPIHPGPAPQHATGANAATHAETTCLYDATLKELATATMVAQELEKQILAAVDRIYLATLDNNVFGFANVTVDAMLTHAQHICHHHTGQTQMQLR